MAISCNGAAWVDERPVELIALNCRVILGTCGPGLNALLIGLLLPRAFR